MELKWLEDFVALATTRSFSRAAETRHVTQPGFSRRLKSLETWFGVPLIDRSTYPVALTAAGEMLYETANRVVGDLYRVRRDARVSIGVSERTLQFAMPHSLALYFFPRWWRSNVVGSDIAAKVVADNFNDCVEMLANHTCQFLFCYLHQSSRAVLDDLDFVGVKVGQDFISPVSGVNDDGTPCHMISPSAKEPLPLLGYTPDSFLGKVTSGIMRENEPHARFCLRYESALAEALKAEALVGEGIAWLPQGLIQAELSDGSLVHAGGENWSAPLDIWLYRHSKNSTPVVDAVWAKCVSTSSRCADAGIDVLLDGRRRYGARGEAGHGAQPAGTSERSSPSPDHEVQCH
jgi:DNA-binding transcriptional LysR family regulator